MFSQTLQARKIMTENQEKQMMTMLTGCVNGIQRLEDGQTRLESDVAVLKTDVTELKQGQVRLEKETQKITKAITILTEDSLQTRVKVGLLEDKIELSN